MITYEASVICDTCKTGIAGDLHQNGNSARVSAMNRAGFRGWHLRRKRDGSIGARCPSCTGKVIRRIGRKEAAEII